MSAKSIVFKYRQFELSKQNRQRALKGQLNQATGKLEMRLQNLTKAYTDPDIKMPKMEYIAQRKQIEMELKSIGEQLQEIENELSNLPTPEEYETVEKFAEQIRQRIGGEGWDIQPQEKRRVLELLHTKVWIGLDYTVRVTGWFGETEGFTYKSRSRFAPRTRSAHKAELQFALRQNHAVRNHNSRYRLHTSILSGPGDM